MAVTEFENSLEFARSMDARDPLAGQRTKFHIPRIDGKEVHYFCGNSLGLQPKSVRAMIEQELLDWEQLGVEGHFHGKNPWFSYHKMFAEPLARIVGAEPDEVVAMNSLSTNLHLLMVSFYRPDTQRYKLICEAGAFPSDQYAFESQVRFHGFSPEDAIVEIAPREGEYTLRTEDIIATIEQHGPQTALVLLSGVQYYTGQAYDIAAISAAGHKAGAIVGFDLAHAAGNVRLALHDWNVDFAVWCSYKYLNSGPGSVAGAFVHARHADSPALPRFAGWWGNDEAERFQMKKGFRPAQGAAGWQLSNAPVLSMAAHKAALNEFDAAGMDALCNKRGLLAGFLEFVIEDARRTKGSERLSIITPRTAADRGAQISMLVHYNGKAVFDSLMQNRIIVDWREPDVIRAAAVPMYNSFEDVYHFGSVLGQVL